MTEDDRPHGPYNLPGPDMNVFGSDQAEGNGASERADEPTVPGTPGESGTPHGTMRFQDAETTTPRPPTLAEQRARRSAEAERAAERAAADRTAQTRRRVMIGSGVTIGVVGLIGAWYLLASPQNVTARCTTADGPQPDTVVQDQYCDQSYVTSHGGYISNGFIFMPILGGGFRQYHYYYGGTGTFGQRASGGSFTAPSHATVRTGSGTTIQRGGFGISGRSGVGSSSGGKTGGGSGGKSGGS